MSLNERKIKILKAIINDYIVSAEPVGSRTIAKKYDLGISSATIRNEMSDLEEMGFIIQPHASAGRIPSDMGYRFYVDQIMRDEELSPRQQELMQNVVNKNISRIDYLMEETAKALAILTRYTTIISEPVIKKTRLKQIRFIPLDSQNILLIVATEENFSKNHVIKINKPMDEQKLFEMSSIINTMLQGCTRNDISDCILNELVTITRDYPEILSPMLKAIRKTISTAESVQIHLGGEKNILAFPEFSDIEKAKSIFQTLEEKDVLLNLLGENPEDKLKISIGKENTIEEMHDCSIIKTSYKVGNDIYGTIGILGPTRMDYPQVISVLNGMVKSIEKVIWTISNGNNDT